ncbi:MAG: serine/threonine protein kinase [Deltaproteobacteria bacterium]|nr:serine/threonine protein kinase [Deltaproteobacteria bacterium]
MTGEPEPSVPDGEREARRTDPTAPTTERDEVPSEVRPSAPTIQGDQGQSDPGVSPARPVVVRTPVPPTPLDYVVPQLSTTTPTGMAARPEGAGPGSVTLRSGGVRSMVGSTLGRYEIIEELGHGGMATVYRARDPRLERDVALKVIHRHLRDNPEIAQRFRHEAKAVAKLKHPSIVEIYDVPDTEDDERFLVAELVEGPSLRKYLQTLRQELGNEHRGLFPPELAAALLLQVLSALERAHEEGIVHRDVKPENILVAMPRARTEHTPTSSPTGRGSDSGRPMVVAKLTDFGIAKILDAQSMTSTGQILGSPAHMAPEQIESGDITAKVDIFACGVLLYELLTDSLPFDGKNPAQVIRKVLEGDFSPPDRVVPQVGGRFSAIVSSMLARDPERRPANVAAIETTLRAELAAMGIRDPSRELSELFRDPRGVVAGWGERMKPLLLERAMEARARGDVVGSAHDLNRALAYDPTDPKLVRAVTTMRSRERRLRSLRRGLPLSLAALLVSGGTFALVRWTRTPGPVATAASTSAAPVPTKSVTAIATTAAPPPPSVTPPPSATTPATVAVLTAIPPIITAPPADAASKATRRVRFNVSLAASYSVDGGPSIDPFKEPVQDLSVGEHTVSIVGRKSCCDPFTRKFRVEAGEGEQVFAEKLTLKPALITVSGATGATLTVRRASDDVVIASGPAPLKVPLTDTQLMVKVTGEATDFPPKTETYNLVPGDTRPFRFEK